VTGTWLGEYTYGEAYQGTAGKSVPFTMSLTESWMGRVVGYVRDDASKGGQPERGKIHGGRRGHMLEFVKTMPTADLGVRLRAAERRPRKSSRSLPRRTRDGGRDGDRVGVAIAVAILSRFVITSASSVGTAPSFRRPWHPRDPAPPAP
jgi:hypothetical protein